MVIRGRPQDMIPGTQYEETPVDYEGPVEFVNWGGHRIAAYGASRLNNDFFNIIAKRRQDNRSVIIIVTGDPGEGKSYLALRFAEIFDKKFRVLDPQHPDALDPGTNPSQVPFERESFLFLIGEDSPLDFGQCIVPDEAQFAMGARHWYDDLQKDLMEQIESVRSKGFIIIIVALNIELLDKIIRKFVLTYMFHVEDRGRAVVYRLITPRFGGNLRTPRLGELILRVPNYEQCTNPDCLRCDESGIKRRQWQKRDKWDEEGFTSCKALRPCYERSKKHFIDLRGAKSKDKAQAESVSVKVHTLEELADIVNDNKDKLQYITRGVNAGRVRTMSIVVLLKDNIKKEISNNKAYQVREYVEMKYPELKKSLRGT